MPSFTNHYTVLNITPFTATPSEIKKAYHKMALKYHPDKVNVARYGTRPKSVVPCVHARAVAVGVCEAV